MKRLLLILTIASVALCQTVHAQYYSVNYDTRTVAAMVAAFGTEAVAEGYYREQVDDILKHCSGGRYRRDIRGQVLGA